MNKNVTRLLTLGSFIGVITTAYAAIKGYEKTKDILTEHEISFKDALKDKELRIDILKATAPVIASAVVTEGAIIANQVVNVKTIAAATAAAGAIGSQLKNIDRIMPKVIGREAWLELKSKMNLDEAKKTFNQKIEKKVTKIEKKMADDEEVYYDSVTKQYFAASEKDILKAEIELNKTFMRENEVAVSDYISFYGKKVLVTEPKDDDWGWYMDADFDYEATRSDDGYYISLKCEKGDVDGDHEAIIITPSILPSDPTSEWSAYKDWKSMHTKYRPEPGDQIDLPFAV